MLDFEHRQKDCEKYGEYWAIKKRESDYQSNDFMTTYMEVKMIEELNKIDLPWSLLLDADPDKEKVQVYVSKGNGWIWKEKEKQ